MRSVKPFLETLAELGITNAQVSDSIPFTTPKDGLRNRKYKNSPSSFMSLGESFLYDDIINDMIFLLF